MGIESLYPETKVGDYLENFEVHLVTSCSSIKRGLGVKMERSGDDKEIEFNKDGILIRFAMQGPYLVDIRD